MYVTQSGKSDLGRLYRINFFTDNAGDNDPIVAISQYFQEPITSYEAQGKAGQFITIDMINTQGRGGPIDVYVDGVLALANIRPTAGMGKPASNVASDELFIGDCCGVSGAGTLDVDFVEFYDGVGGLPGPIPNPEPASAWLLIAGGLIHWLLRRRR
jgi:hypothetical protein